MNTHQETKLQDFISSLEVGSQVAFGRRPRWNEEPHYFFSTVVKITPSGQIKTKNGQVFNSDGSSRGRRNEEFLEDPVVAQNTVRQYRERQQAEAEEVRKELHQLIDQIKSLNLLKYCVRVIKSELGKM